MLLKRIELIVLGILIIGIIGYAGTGIVYAGVMVANADRTLNTVVSHENDFSKSFNEITTEHKALSGSNFNPKDEVALADKSVMSSQLAAQTINQDDAALGSVERSLEGSRWLTAVSRSSLDRESTRIRHLQNSLAAGRTIAAAGVVDGSFWHSVYSALADLDLINTQAGTGDFTSARTTLTIMKADVDNAVQQPASPSLPADLRQLVIELQTLVADYSKQLDAQIAGDDATVAAQQAVLDADRTKLASYDMDKVGTEIDAFYKPLIDRFNSEMAAATA
ncbi:MAG: hypothetical protein E6I61_08315 [Chloroflexi bacterium]|nr:MAG: hypothetical protein E6I71_00505 [Chloroflexota bacterium]TME40756.1 MAG: hypothetical protein E6I61_08315 [Chloroflexota bacterium]